MNILVAARRLLVQCRYSSSTSAASFNSGDLEALRQEIASRPSVPLTAEEKQFLPRAAGSQVETFDPEPRPEPSIPSPQAGSSAQSDQAGPSVPVPVPNKWVLEVQKQIASRAKTPAYWGKAEAMAYRCGFCKQLGHGYHYCPRQKNSQ